MCFSFFVCLLSPLVWFFLWLPEEVLALLFLLHRENGDFSILMKDMIVMLPSKCCGVSYDLIDMSRGHRSSRSCQIISPFNFLSCCFFTGLPDIAMVPEQV